MGTPNLWKAYLKPTDTSWAYVDNTGNVVITSDPLIGEANPLRDMPSNWEEIELGYIRSESLDGIFSKTTGEYEFVGDGAKILRHFIFTQGYTANLIFEVYIRNNNWTYDLWEKSDLSFEKPPIQSPTLSVNALMFEKGLAQRIKNSLNTPYEVDATGSTRVYFLGTRVRGKYNYRFGEAFVRQPWPLVFGIGVGKYTNSFLVSVNDEGFKPVAIVQASDKGPRYIGDYTPISGLISDEGYIFKNTDTQPFAVSYQIENLIPSWRYVAASGVGSVVAKLELFLLRQLPSGSVSFTILATNPVRTLTSSTTFTTEASISLPLTPLFTDLQPDEMLFLAFGVEVDPSSTPPHGAFDIRAENFADAKFSLQTEFNTKPTFINGVRQPVMFGKIINAVANGEFGVDPYESNFLNTPSAQYVDNFPYHTLFTNGLEIKGVTNTRYKVELGDMISHFKALYPVGIGVVNDKVKLEHLSYFYNDSVTIGDLGEGADAKITLRSDMGTLLKFGWDFDEDVDVLNGNDDYNTILNFKSNGKFQSEKTLEFISPYVASMYQIEKSRVQDAGKDQTGTKVNDQLFVFSIYRDLVPFIPTPEYIPLYTELWGGVVSGVNFPEWAYNVDLSPRRNFERLRGLINSYCNPSAQPLEFQTAERNDALVSKFRDGFSPPTYFSEITEKADFTPSTSEIFWLPFDYEGEHIIPYDLRQLMAVNPYGAFTLTINGKPARIFIDEIKVRPGKRNTFSVKGRFTPSTDLTKFI